MDKSKIIIFLSFIFYLTANAQNENFEIKIIQDSIVYKAEVNNTVWLQKKPFKIQIELMNLEGVYLYASFKDDIYKIKNDKPIPEFKNIPFMSMAEETFNVKQELIINPDGWAFWFYKASDNWHRMDKEVVVSKNSVIISKTIKQFYFPEKEEEVLIEENIKQLYLFFFSAKANENSELEKELQRFKLKINWL
jgi:hypothetical protein